MTNDGRPEPQGLPSTAQSAISPIAARICPYLATAGHAWRAAVPMREHVCTAVQPPVPLATDKQRRLCLTEAHPTCATFVAAREHEARRRGSDRPAPRSRSYPTTTPVLLERVRRPLPAFGEVAARGMGQLLLVALLAVALVAIAVARLGAPGSTTPGNPSAPAPSSVAGGLGSLSAAAAGGSPSSSPAAAVSASPPPPSPRPSPTVRPSASPRPTARPTTSATATPSASPSASTSTITYTVRSGDTLSSIAARYGTTAAAIQTLNGIKDPRLIYPGEVLRIP